MDESEGDADPPLDEHSVSALATAVDELRSQVIYMQDLDRDVAAYLLDLVEKMQRAIEPARRVRGPAAPRSRARPSARWRPIRPCGIAPCTRRLGGTSPQR